MYRVFDDTTPLVEGMSIDEAFLDVRGMERVFGTPREMAVRLRRDVLDASRAADHGRRGEDEVPRQGGERGGQAGRPARRAARGRAGVPAPAPGRAALGRRAGDRAQAQRAGDRDRRPGRVARPRPRSCCCSDRPRAATCTRSRTTATRGASRPAVAGARSARSGRSAARPSRLRQSTPRSSRSSSASRGACALRAGSAARSCCACASPTSRGRRARTRCRARPPAHGTILAAARGLLAAATPLIERQGLDARGHCGDQPRRRARRAAGAAVRSGRRGSPRHGRRRGARALRLGRDHARRCCSAATRESRCRCCRIEPGVARSAA